MAEGFSVSKLKYAIVAVCLVFLILSINLYRASASLYDERESLDGTLYESEDRLMNLYDFLLRSDEITDDYYKGNATSGYLSEYDSISQRFRLESAMLDLMLRDDSMKEKNAYLIANFFEYDSLSRRILRSEPKHPEVLSIENKKEAVLSEMLVLIRELKDDLEPKIESKVSDIEDKEDYLLFSVILLVGFSGISLAASLFLLFRLKEQRDYAKEIDEDLVKVLLYTEGRKIKGLETTFSDIKKEFHLTFPTVQSRINELVEKGMLVVRKDGRNKLLSVTKIGELVINKYSKPEASRDKKQSPPNMAEKALIDSEYNEALGY
ncbi:MAG: hypothetical protein ACLFPQ_05260 [Candidatus Woesearchaeota archaeon]